MKHEEAAARFFMFHVFMFHVSHVFARMKQKFRISLRGPFGESTLDVAHDQAILDAALRAGLHLPNSCCQGWCLTCAAKLLTGQVAHPHARRYYPKDAEAHFILPC